MVLQGLCKVILTQSEPVNEPTVAWSQIKFPAVWSVAIMWRGGEGVGRGENFTTAVGRRFYVITVPFVRFKEGLFLNAKKNVSVWIR